MDLLAVIAIIVGILGIIGGIVPVLPGPPLSWAALLCMYFSKLNLAAAAQTADKALTIKELVIWLVLAIVITILDYILPGKIARLTGAHKSAERGALIGIFIGIFLTPIGMILGCLAGAFLGEFVAEQQGLGHSIKAALGAFAGVILSTGIKVIFSAIALWEIIRLSI